MRDEQRRMRNLRECHEAVDECLRMHFIREYMPGQVTYNLGEYPARFSIAPTDYDAELLRTFADHGVELIQIHEEWSDSQRVLGATKHTSHDPAGLRQFVHLVHDLGMKIIPYASTGFFDIRDPDFREEWYDPARSTLVELYYHYAHCSPTSPSWREYLLPRLERILDDYGFDGLYNDMGYYRNAEDLPLPGGHVRPAPWPHSAIEDLLALVMDLCHERGGVLKCHGVPPEVGQRTPVYDYLWVGEGARDLDRLRRESRTLAPYVSPCPDMSRAQVVDEHDLYLHTIPYMQFPLRVDGRPMTGQRACVEGIAYQPAEKCFWTRHCLAMLEHHRANPEGPHSYGWWDSVPGRPEARAIWLDYLGLYRPMVTNGGRAWLEIRRGSLFTAPVPEQVTASLFANEQVHLVLANYGERAEELTSSWRWEDRRTGNRAHTWRLQPRQMLLLQRVEQGERA
ncbi:MAG: hypothetical protein AB7Y46_03485 [Armatimonadota bacterium]